MYIIINKSAEENNELYKIMLDKTWETWMNRMIID